MPTPEIPRLGVVPYLNALPLVEGLSAAVPESHRILATPRELAGLMAAGELDIALLPTFEVLRGGPFRIIEGCAIACEGPVKSVQLFHRVPLDQVRRVLLDRGSLTSVHLARVLMAEHWHIDPECVTSDLPIAGDFDLEASDFEAAVVIGDAALDLVGRGVVGLDLGEAWQTFTGGLPFVFAAWAVRPGYRIPPSLVQAFTDARALGERNVYEIAKAHAADHGRSVRDAVDYLSRSIHYRMGMRELEAMTRYRELLVRHGHLPASAVMPEVIVRRDWTPNAPVGPRH